MRGGEKCSVPNQEFGFMSDSSYFIDLLKTYKFPQNHNFRNKFQSKCYGPLQL